MSNAVLTIATFTLLFVLQPFGLIVPLYSRLPQDAYPLHIPTGNMRIYHLLLTGFVNIAFCVLSYGLDRIGTLASRVDVDRLPEHEKQLVSASISFSQFCAIFMIGDNIVRWTTAYWNSGILTALLLLFYSNALLDSGVLHFVLRVLDTVYLSNCSSSIAYNTTPEVSQETSDEELGDQVPFADRNDQ